MSSLQTPDSARQIPMASGVSLVNTGGHLEPTIEVVDSGEVAPAEENEVADSGEVQVAPAEERNVVDHELEGHARRQMLRRQNIVATRLETALLVFHDQPHMLALIQDSNAVSNDEKSENELSAKKTR
ncbi:hypothetical protein H4Q26_017372 [Puccinia striiformis f. sp. tritici PST-130]|nr:hypothetical protein H4Q26_017372 [Puccinia striiformis f. sp. tritici PST-130]